MDSSQAADLAIVIICACLPLAYNLFFFTPNLRFRMGKRCYASIWSVTRCRPAWMDMMMNDPKEGITAAQTARNQVIGVSVLAAAATTLSAQLINVMTDPTKLAQIDHYSSTDPITGSRPLASASVKVAIALGLLFVAQLSMMQCVRMAIHVGFVARTVAGDPQRYGHLRSHAKELIQRASTSFAVGLRILFASFPFIFWCVGSMALLIATVIEVGSLVILDYIRVPIDEADDNPALEGSVAAAGPEDIVMMEGHGSGGTEQQLQTKVA